MKAQRIGGSLGNLGRHSPLGVFLQDKIIFDFFDRGA